MSALAAVGSGSIETDDFAAARNEVHEALESRFNRIEIFVDIGVIEFDRGEDKGVWKVVQKLWTLVEKCRVVFVAFEDEMVARSEAEAAAEIFGDASNQE